MTNKFMDSSRLRGILLRLQDKLSDNDRQRLHFFFGSDSDIPRRIRDDPSLGGTLRLIDVLFDQDKINERDFTLLINAFKEIQCYDAARTLQDYMRQMQSNGQNQSVRRLTSILLQDLEFDKISTNSTSTSIDTHQLINNEFDLDENKTNNTKMNYINRLKYPVLFILFLFAGFLLGFFVNATSKHKYVNKIQRLTNEIKYLRDFELKRPNPCLNTRWNPNATTVAGGNENGNELNQLSTPRGLDIDYDGTLYIADSGNHRIVEWKKNATIGRIAAGGNKGDRIDQLNHPSDVVIDHHNNSLIIADLQNNRVVRWPRKNGRFGQILISNIYCWGLAMDYDGNLYISDVVTNQVKRWNSTSNETILLIGEHGKGDQLNQLNQPHFIFIDENESIYIADLSNNRVMLWKKDEKQGTIIADAKGRGKNSIQLASPAAVFVDRLGTIYIVDGANNRVVRVLAGIEGRSEIVVGDTQKGNHSNQLHFPADLAFDAENNLYVVDGSNHRVQKFTILS